MSQDSDMFQLAEKIGIAVSMSQPCRGQSMIYSTFGLSH